jgi:Flp pilus assembly protein TadG
MSEMLSGLRNSKGQSLVEFALIFPFLLVLIGGVIDFGLAIFAGHISENAAREGARFAATIPPPGPAAGSGSFPGCQTAGSTTIQTTCKRIPNIGLFSSNNYSVTVSAVTGAVPNQAVTVTVTGTYNWFLLHLIASPFPLLGYSFPNSLTISRSATMRWEWQPPA